MNAEKIRGNAAELFADSPYDATTLASMIEAYAAACHELGVTRGGARFGHGDELRLRLVARILKAAAAGERNPDRMKLLALHAIDSQSMPQVYRQRPRS